MKMKEELDIKKRTIKAFLDLIILRRLTYEPMTGYRVGVILLRDFGISVSPDTIYHTIYAMERKGLLRCIRNKPGRVYSLTRNGQSLVEILSHSVNEAQTLIETILGE